MSFVESEHDLEKELGERNSSNNEDENHQHLSRTQEEIIEAAEPTFIERDPQDGHEDEENNDLERIASSKPSVNNIKSVPNGGLWAWLQVLGSFFLFFNTCE